MIKQIILNTTGFDAVNRAVRSRLIDQLTILLHGCKLGLNSRGESILKHSLIDGGDDDVDASGGDDEIRGIMVIATVRIKLLKG